MTQAVAPDAPVGVFDSGAGGLSIAAAIRRELPRVPIVYFADTAYAPYGPRSDQEIIERTQACCARLVERGVRALVVACNTATTNGIDAVRQWSLVPVVGVEPGVKPAALATRNGVVGVLATAATLASRRYAELLQRVQAQAPALRFVEHAGDGWVELVEAGDLESPHALDLVRASVQPLVDAGADTLVLGCTHYPFLRKAITAIAPGVALVETGPAVARELARRLPAIASGAPLADDGGGMSFESSGDTAQFAASARHLLTLLEDGGRI